MSQIVVTPPASGRPRRGREPLPLGPPRLVDVHVRVDQPGQQRQVARGRRCGPRPAPRRSRDRRDRPSRDRDGRRDASPSGSTIRRDRITRSRSSDPPTWHAALQPKLVELSAGSDGWYSSPIQPSYPWPASCRNSGSKSSVPVPGAPRPGESATCTCAMSPAYRASMSATSSPIFARWYRSARKRDVRRPWRARASMTASALPLVSIGNRGDVDGVDRLDERRRPGPGRAPAAKPGSRSPARPAPRVGPVDPEPVRRVQPPHPVRAAISTQASTFSRNAAARAGATRSRVPRPPCPRCGSSAQTSSTPASSSDADERVRLRVRRCQRLPRPPELHPAEPGRPRGRGRSSSGSSVNKMEQFTSNRRSHVRTAESLSSAAALSRSVRVFRTAAMSVSPGRTGRNARSLARSFICVQGLGPINVIAVG